MRLAEEAGAKLSDPRSRVLSVRILHTSDWHIGRTFHGWSTLDALRGVFDAMIAAMARSRGASLATAPRMVHPRYRNYFTPERNDIHAGFRSCAL